MSVQFNYAYYAKFVGKKVNNSFITIKYTNTYTHLNSCNHTINDEHSLTRVALYLAIRAWHGTTDPIVDVKINIWAGSLLLST